MIHFDETYIKDVNAHLMILEERLLSESEVYLRDQMIAAMLYISSLRGVLREIAAPLVGTPLGDPWDFYDDLRHLASSTIGETYVKSDFRIERQTPDPMAELEELAKTSNELTVRMRQVLDQLDDKSVSCAGDADA